MEDLVSTQSIFTIKIRKNIINSNHYLNHWILMKVNEAIEKKSTTIFN